MDALPAPLGLLQPMIIASAAFYGILPRAFDFVGLTAVATFIYQLQATGDLQKRSAS